MPGAPEYRGSFVSPKSRRLETTLPWFSSAPFIILKSFWCNENKKEIFNIFFVEKGLLFTESSDQAPLKCITGDEGTKVLKEGNSRDCDQHQGSSILFKQLIYLGYYWPIMEADVTSFAWKCQAWQLKSNRIHGPAVELCSYLPLGYFTLGPSILVVPTIHHLEATFGASCNRMLYWIGQSNSSEVT